MRHIISILLENEAGALSRVAGLFSARGYNIESLTVAPTEEQLNKLVDVVKLIDLTEGDHIEREMMMIKTRVTGEDREEVKRLAEIFRGRIIDVTDTTYTVELTGSASKLDAFITALNAPILETVRSGVAGIARGEKSLQT